MPRPRRGWGRTARLGLAVLVCTFAGAGQAQSLDDAVDKLAEYLMLRGNLKGKEVLVRPSYFFELGSERNLPLSEHLALRFTRKFRSYGVRPVSRSEDEDTAITLQGRWHSESEDLVLSVEAMQSVGDGLNTGSVHASGQERVPVANIDVKYLKPDIESHGRYVARQLGKGIEANTSGHGRYGLHVRSFSAPGVAEPDWFNRYLFGKWLPAFTGSRRFSLVHRRDRSDGELHGDVFVAEERIDVHLYILDGQRQEVVAATTVEMDRGLFSPDFFGPDVTAKLAKCAGLVDVSRLGDARRCYEDVRAGAPGDSVAVEGVRAGLKRIAKMEKAAVRGVVDAIGRGGLGEAREGLKRLRKLNAGHPRLGELEGEIARAERMREERLQAERERKERMRVGRMFRDCPGCPELVVVREGTYMMGSPSSESGRDDDEGPEHRVRIGYRFAVGVKEVTRGEFARFVSETGHSMGNSCYVYEGGEWEERSGRNWKNPGFSQTDGHPVVCVNWDDAQAYVDWLSGRTGKEYRLLSESEWEYVARGGTRTARYWGESESGQCRYANGADREAKRHNSGWTTVDCDDGYYQTAPVETYEANGFGLHNVLGNVWEWTEDCWNGGYSGAPTDGSAWESGECGRRVVRGGSWYSNPRILRSANRSRYSTGNRNYYAGFRVARTLTP